MKDVVQSIIDRATKAGATFADARAVEKFSTNVGRQDGQTDRLSGDISLGVGVRVLELQLTVQSMRAVYAPAGALL